MSNQTRHPAGVPAGGQFAPSAHSEAEGVALDGHDPDDFEVRKANYLVAAAYPTLEDWARDSDYEERPPGSGDWFDEEGNGPLDLDEQLLGALDAQDDYDARTDELRALVAMKVAGLHESLTDMTDADDLRERDPEHPDDARTLAVGAMRLYRDQLASTAGGAGLDVDERLATVRSMREAFEDELAAAAIAKIADETRKRCPHAVAVEVLRGSGSTLDLNESLAPLNPLDADGQRIAFATPAERDTWRAAVSREVTEIGDIDAANGGQSAHIAYRENGSPSDDMEVIDLG